MSKDLTRSFTHKTEITTAKPTLPISTGSTGMVSQERYNKALDSLEFHAKNSVLKDQQITQLRAVLGPAIEQAKMRDKYPLSFANLGADDLVKALLAAGEILDGGAS